MHGLRSHNEAFFHRDPKLLGLGRQLGQINFGAFGIFLADLGTVSPLPMFSINQPLFVQKTKLLYPNFFYLILGRKKFEI